MSELQFKRFTINQRIQHIIFLTSFILLVYTGFPLKFPDEWWARWMIASVGGFDNRTFIHHYAGLVMIGICVYHVVYHILDKPRYDILFNTKDVKDFIQNIKYFLKYTDEYPKFGRYTWKQKFEYFGAGFGGVVMGLTGILMWHPFEAMKYFPIGFIQIANLIHTWEAVLASIAIFIGHLYDEHLGKFPNMSWLSGNISEEEMMHEHPLEYEMVMNSINKKIDDAVRTSTSNNKVIYRVAKLLFTMIFLAITLWILWISYHVLMEALTTYVF